MSDYLEQLGITADTLNARGLISQTEAETLQLAETDANGREYFLTPEAANAWHAMKLAAQKDGIILLMLSAFRSVRRQVEIIQDKLDQGISIDAVLNVCAPPGFSEHHTGRAIDIGTPDEPVLEISFEATAAFVWLQQHAASFGFVMTYPQDNPYGFQYEPWHWCYQTANRE